MEFRLPETGGTGRPLTREEFDSLTARLRPKTFFSRELCARYFTWRDGEGAHLVLFDDAATLRRKLLLGEREGYDTAFLLWPEVREILREILPDGRSSGCDARSCCGGP